ncbi:unnamed protein product [Ectocarpus fasciculatus]
MFTAPGSNVLCDGFDPLAAWGDGTNGVAPGERLIWSPKNSNEISEPSERTELEVLVARAPDDDDDAAAPDDDATAPDDEASTASCRIRCCHFTVVSDRGVGERPRFNARRCAAISARHRASDSSNGERLSILHHHPHPWMMT